MVANSDAKRIGSIKKLGVERCVQEVRHHMANLFFGGIAIARNRLFYTAGSIFHNRDIARQGCRHHHTLRPAQLEHRLDVLPKKRVFNRHFIRVVLLNEPDHCLVQLL